MLVMPPISIPPHPSRVIPGAAPQGRTFSFPPSHAICSRAGGETLCHRVRVRYLCQCRAGGTRRPAHTASPPPPDLAGAVRTPAGDGRQEVKETFNPKKP